jgi:hypothetical protein
VSAAGYGPIGKAQKLHVFDKLRLAAEGWGRLVVVQACNLRKLWRTRIDAEPCLLSCIEDSSKS